MTTTTHSPQLQNRRPRSAGSVLLVALVFAAMLALSLGSFLNLANQSANYAYRTFYVSAALNGAETGLEQALWAINKRVAGDTSIWQSNNWTVLSDGSVHQTFTLRPLSGGATGRVNVFVSSASMSGRPYVIARSIITPTKGAPIERWVRISLTRRSRFANGLIARDSISFSGNGASVDSYDSRKGAYTPSPSTTNRFDHGSAGSASISVDSMDVSNADIWGSAVVGYSDPNLLKNMVGPQGTIGPFGTPKGTVVMENVLTDFTANFDDEPHPAANPSSYNITISRAESLPRPKDTPATDGKYYYNVTAITGSLSITNKVVIRMIPMSGDSIRITGRDSITIDAPYHGITPQLAIYTQGDVAIAGEGIVTGGAPADFALYGTRPQSDGSAQNFSITGNGVLSAIVYAPNADIKLAGGGSSGNVYGGIIGKTISVVGGAAFHYDEALADLNQNASFTFSEWIEYVSSADRQTYLPLMDF